MRRWIPSSRPSPRSYAPAPPPNGRTLCERQIASATTPNEHTPAAIAVLPLVNLSADSGSGYVADGLTAEIINALTRSGLRVTALTSALIFKGRHADVRTIAESLHVANVI